MSLVIKKIKSNLYHKQVYNGWGIKRKAESLLKYWAKVKYVMIFILPRQLKVHTVLSNIYVYFIHNHIFLFSII